MVRQNAPVLQASNAALSRKVSEARGRACSSGARGPRPRRRSPRRSARGREAARSPARCRPGRRQSSRGGCAGDQVHPEPCVVALDRPLQRRGVLLPRGEEEAELRGVRLAVPPGARPPRPRPRAPGSAWCTARRSSRAACSRAGYRRRRWRRSSPAPSRCRSHAHRRVEDALQAGVDLRGELAVQLGQRRAEKEPHRGAVEAAADHEVLLLEGEVQGARREGQRVVTASTPTTMSRETGFPRRRCRCRRSAGR